MTEESITALIVDDEIDARSNIRKHLIPFAHKIEVILEAKNADDAIQIINNQKVDLIFLDIAMPRKSGFDLLSEIPDYGGEVIFVTSFNKYAEEAFKYLALGYIVKPLAAKEFNHTLERTLEIIQLRKSKQQYKSVLHLLEEHKSPNSKIVVPTDEGLEVLGYDNIYYFEGERNYTKIICTSRKLLISKNLSKIEIWLNPAIFMRVHRSYIVNLTKVIKVDKNGHVYLDNQEKIKITKQNKDEIAKRLASL